MNPSELATHPSNTCMAKREASWLLLGKPFPMGSAVQSANNTHE